VHGRAPAYLALNQLDKIQCTNVLLHTCIGLTCLLSKASGKWLAFNSVNHH